MNKIDHIVINVDEKYQKDKKMIDMIQQNGFPYAPKKGKRTKGFKISNLWIGKEYLELVNITKKDGGGWKKDWTELYNRGTRGAICLMIDVSDIDSLHQSLLDKAFDVQTPERIEYKLFGLLKISSRWRNMYLPFFEKEAFQIGFQQLDNEEISEKFQKKMIPNSISHKIMGMTKIIINGKWTELDYNMIENTFRNTQKEGNSLKIKLNNGSDIIFVENNDFSLYVEMDNQSLQSKSITKIENVYLVNN
ncbi:transporter [Bacillus pumilus]|uniref:hypothetical protein n=1 Tax=Bacillus pumilus TaxID=1408 RepID=UPI00017A6385|nr:hypothetical protein [Bacillus pumilus]EDW22162.1 hypothetical protein BAT_0358 [Bacillus pumilus ATCC 7061]MCR4352394.1 transporter [Bacillus pumilus]MCY7504204.1 transporter [Bacillus pumilus]MDR4268807.1 transporter [Bacillus pumilus]MED4629496.1 transporter [Bacillus pumilus]